MPPPPWDGHGKVGQMPVLRQFAKGVVFDLPTQVPQVPNGGAVLRVQVAGPHPDPGLLFLLALPGSAHPLALRPALPHLDDPHRIGAGVRETQRT